ncbi:AzlD domain-containing protein [Mangrovicoccus sp. HB161399]|uniref:AzlD domain-containing protein n=1 Tax=Mangrovicoccus sp. HB161399 TaxID=2720392 RepID=UPI00155528ED|nr:AzlD domain-containing protein [Mangrovicoccus sp. HB161399]
MTGNATAVWTVIAGLAVGTFLIRFSFLGLLGQRSFPEWALRMLRYTPVAVLPGLVAPLVLWPQATGGEPDAARLLAALAAAAAGVLTRSVLWSVAAGLAALYGGLALFG